MFRFVTKLNSNWRDWMHPELRLLDSETERRRVYRTAGRNLGIWPFQVAIIVCAFCLIVERGEAHKASYMAWMEAGAIGNPPMRTRTLEIIFYLGLLLPLLVRWFARNRYRRLFRCELVSAGIPICTRCGYDLTGNTSGVCSECGTKVGVSQSAGLVPPTERP